MWDEEINKKIKDAADQYHPAYDDTAWNKMEQMLNEHLPVKKDRRKIIYFLPIIVLLTGVLVFVVFRKEIPVSPKNAEKTLPKNKTGKPEKEISKTTDGQIAASTPLVKVLQPSIPAEKKENRLTKRSPNIISQASIKHIKNFSVPRDVDVVNNIKNPNAENVAGTPENQKKNTPHLSIKKGAVTRSGSISGTAETVSGTTGSTNEQTNTPGIKDINTDNAIVITGTNATTTNEKEPINSNEVTRTDSSNDQKEKVQKITARQINPKNRFIQNFGFGLSVGPDISGVDLSSTGKVTLAYGAHLSYAFSNRFTLRTGFYVADKIYTADNAEYHVSSGSTWNRYLQSVAANCKVFEVPLTISYTFSRTKNHSWFASAGLSSYLMKRESYIYYYKNAADSTYERPWSVSNQNKHYFSVLNISGGYVYSVNKHLSIIGEPYLKLPFSGIGAGKIKLNSAGILFTVAIKPF